MAVYVDRLHKYPRTRKWPFGEACHMFADDLEELHAFAALLGLRRAWFQSTRLLDHYDLTRHKRAVAVLNGAKEVEYHEVAAHFKPPYNKRFADVTEDQGSDGRSSGEGKKRRRRRKGVRAKEEGVGRTEPERATRKARRRRPRRVLPPADDRGE